MGWSAACGFAKNCESIRHTLAGIVLAMSLVASGSAATPRTVRPVDGTPFSAAITAIDAAWNITLTAEEKPRTFPAAALVQWGRPAELVRSPVLVLADGGLIVADGVRTEKSTLKADGDLLGAIKLPLDRMAGVVFRPPTDRPRRDQLFDRVTAGSERSDRLLLLNGDEVSGTIEAIEEDRVRVQADVGPLTVTTDRIAAVMFRTPAARPAAPQGMTAWVGLADGSRLRAVGLVVDAAAEKFRVTLAGEVMLSGAADDLVWLQPLGGRAIYLSDLRVEGYRHVPFLSLAWPYRIDRSVQDAWLRADGRLYRKGLGMHSASRLTYLLDGSYGRFQAELAIDDETAGGGSVRFRVFVDGKPKYTSEVIRGGMRPVPVSVDIPGAKRLDLIVDFADRGDERDHADWLNARVVVSGR